MLIIINGTLIKWIWWLVSVPLISSNNMECPFSSTSKRKTSIHPWIFFSTRNRPEFIQNTPTKSCAKHRVTIFLHQPYRKGSSLSTNYASNLLITFFDQSELYIIKSNYCTPSPYIYLRVVDICKCPMTGRAQYYKFQVLSLYSGNIIVGLAITRSLLPLC